MSVLHINMMKKNTNGELFNRLYDVADVKDNDNDQLCVTVATGDKEYSLIIDKEWWKAPCKWD